MPSEDFVIDRRRLMLGAGAAVAASGLASAPSLVPAAKAATAAAPEAGPIKVGILHSLSGTMAISESPLKDVMQA
jgi:urea transport system substrate-binding protein